MLSQAYQIPTLDLLGSAAMSNGKKQTLFSRRRTSDACSWPLVIRTEQISGNRNKANGDEYIDLRNKVELFVS